MINIFEDKCKFSLSYKSLINAQIYLMNSSLRIAKYFAN
jgi:hypothetical protein